jgi:hypothetical protein
LFDAWLVAIPPLCRSCWARSRGNICLIAPMSLSKGECLVEVVHDLRLDLGRGRLGVEALAQGHGCRYLRWTDGAQLGVEAIREQRLDWP